ncbi:diadenylate cyclase CdaA [Treponema pectinovorum]|uniref:diadenylate cyclase CdaA n=1 Tax=Treponema pectinovorum TaxID=164 RepID=UPI0011CBB3F1|nr:diadenylate cyclase CdaA [Treponema pectinovorum]
MNAFENLVKIYDFIRPIFDIAIMAFIFYKAYEIIVKTNALQIIKAAIVVAMAYALALLLHLSMLLWVLQKLAPGIVICFAIVFQPELRKVFLKIGQSQWFTFGNRSKHTYVDTVIIAAEILSKMKRGMLVVFTRHTKLDDIIETGTKINADLSSALLVTIFGHDTPLHDAACIVQNGKIISAGCFLPLSEQYDIKKTFGTRHRSALGLSEQTDAVVLVVSEESGAISLAYDSQLHYDLNSNQITKQLEKLLDMTAAQKTIEDTIDENKGIYK